MSCYVLIPTWMGVFAHAPFDAGRLLSARELRAKGLDPITSRDQFDVLIQQFLDMPETLNLIANSIDDEGDVGEGDADEDS
eukprot:4160973-Pyramimonas_sp.AAC.1